MFTWKAYIRVCNVELPVACSHVVVGKYGGGCFNTSTT